MGKVRRGLATLPIVLSVRDAEEVGRYMEEKGFRSPAAAGGAVVSAWATERRRERMDSGLKPRPAAEGSLYGSDRDRGLRPLGLPREAAEPEGLELEAWEEVQGEVVSARTEGNDYVLVLRTFSGPVARIVVNVKSQTDLSPTKRRPPVPGDLIGILRTDMTARQYVLRFLSESRRRSRRE